MDSKNSEEEKTPSSEILIAAPNKKGSKKYTTYLGLVDSGSLGSLVNKEIIEFIQELKAKENECFTVIVDGDEKSIDMDVSFFDA